MLPIKLLSCQLLSAGPARTDNAELVHSTYLYQGAFANSSTSNQQYRLSSCHTGVQESPISACVYGWHHDCMRGLIGVVGECRYLRLPGREAHR